MRPPQVPTLRLPRTARSFRRPVVVSAVVHFAVLALLVWQASRSATWSMRPLPGGEGPAGGGGGGAGERISYLTLPAYRAPAAPDHTLEPRRYRIPPPLQVQVRDVPPNASLAEAVPLSLLAGGLHGGPGAGAGIGGGAGGGRGGGLGSGSGPGTGGGGGEVFPPQARYSILPPLPKPASVRGKTFEVRFWVDARGRVIRVDVSPTIPDGDYRKKFVELMYQYTFTPALAPDGTPVNGETVLTITL